MTPSRILVTLYLTYNLGSLPRTRIRTALTYVCKPRARLFPLLFFFYWPDGIRGRIKARNSILSIRARGFKKVINHESCANTRFDEGTTILLLVSLTNWYLLRSRKMLILCASPFVGLRFSGGDALPVMYLFIHHSLLVIFSSYLYISTPCIPEIYSK